MAEVHASGTVSPVNRSSSQALRIRSVSGEPGCLLGKTQGGAGEGTARMLSKSSLLANMWSTSTSIPGSVEGDRKESPSSSLAGGLKIQEMLGYRYIMY